MPPQSLAFPPRRKTVHLSQLASSSFLNIPKRDKSTELASKRRSRGQIKFLEDIRKINKSEKKLKIQKLDLFDNKAVEKFSEHNKLEGNNKGFDFVWSGSLKDLSKFIPKNLRKSLRDKHGVVDGRPFFQHLFEIKLFLEKNRGEVVFLAFRGENHFCEQAKFLFLKFVLSFLGKLLITKALLKEGQSPNELSLKQCVSQNKRVFLVLKSNLKLTQNQLNFNPNQIQQVRVMERLLRKTFFIGGNCFHRVERVESKIQSADLGTHTQFKLKRFRKTLMKSIVQSHMQMAIKLIELFDAIIQKHDDEFWKQSKTLLQWGVWDNTSFLISQYHNVHDFQKLVQSTEHQIQARNSEHPSLFAVNNLTLTVPTDKHKFFKNVLNFEIPTLKNLHSKMTQNCFLHNYMLDLIKRKKTDQLCVNIFKFDFAVKIRLILKLLIFSNIPTRLQVIHIFVFEEFSKQFLKVGFDQNWTGPNGLLLIGDVPKFISHHTDRLRKLHGNKLKLVNKLIIIFKSKDDLYFKYFLNQPSILVRHPYKKSSLIFKGIAFKVSNQIQLKHFELSQKDDLFQLKTSSIPLNTNLFGDNFAGGNRASEFEVGQSENSNAKEEFKKQ